MEVLRSALRHGVGDQDIQHAVRNALLVEESDEDPTRYLVLGPDCGESPKPFDWNFIRDDLAEFVTRFATHEPELVRAA